MLRRTLVATGLAFGASAQAAPPPTTMGSAPPVILSPAPDSVAVTLYRDPDRGERAIDRARPSSFALIAETRTVTLPPGVVTVRFEGVAGGIVPQSAILYGTPPREKNRDAALLSQKGLVDAFTGQQVMLRRTDRATGKVTEEAATIRSAANRMVIQTARGAEAVYCTGLAQTLLYPQAPATLSAKPVLTMTTKDQPGGTATVTLAYLATGFDWDATYVGTLAEDGRSLALLSWLTMASGDETSFERATTSAVAGRIARSATTRDDTGQRARNEARWLDRAGQCWPAGTTSQIPDRTPYPPPPPPPPMMVAMAAPAPIMVTARRSMEKDMIAPVAMTAQAEGLGDLVLYRIPEPVTVAARSQKQVAFLSKPRVDGQLVYRAQAYGGEPAGLTMLFRFRNDKASDLGVALPAGKAVLYQDGAAGRQLVGQATMRDKAVGEEVELEFGQPSGVTMQTTAQDRRGGGQDVTLTLRNANPFAVRFELDLMNTADRRYASLPAPLTAKPGKRVWAVTLPPGTERRVGYAVLPLD